METRTPETRPSAPGALATLHDFLNSGHLAASTAQLAPAVAEAIRLRGETGDTRNSLARDFGLSQSLASAVARGTPLYDDLRSPEAASEWLAARNLVAKNSRVRPDELARLIEFRELLRRLAAANNRGPLDADLVQSLESTTSSVALHLCFEAGGEPVLRPLGAGIASAIGGLLVILFEAQRAGSWQRLKRCPGLGCPFTFYDTSRNRTGTWCSMSVCGNRTKVRNFQERRRTSRASKTTA